MKIKPSYLWIAAGVVVVYIVYTRSQNQASAPPGSGSISQSGTASGVVSGSSGSTDVIGTFNGWIDQLLSI